MDFKPIYSELRRLYNTVDKHNTKDTIQDLIRCIEDLIKMIERMDVVVYNTLPSLPSLPSLSNNKNMANLKLPTLPKWSDLNE